MTSDPASSQTSLSGRKPAPEPVGAWWHTALLIVIIVAISAYQGQPRFLARASRFSSRTPVYIATLAYELVLFAYIWLLALLPRKISIREIIGGKWRRFEDFLIDVAVMFLFWGVVLVVLGVLEFVLHFNGVQAAKLLLPQSWTEVAVFVVLAVTAGFCEEFIFRGYLQRQFFAWTGTAWVAIVLQALVFGSAHLYQGWRSVIAITVYGALFGILAWYRKSLRPGMMQHAGQDSLAGIAGYLATKYKLI
ncbi:MAG TPA: type II CAAX endopeptidase family protein [Candidatus Aquilonibacter sp.]|nr:type II CAAX endopeptidase family protein [Candidatus Baltobacteraceae bacterium]HTZ75342.1 type II CAAX endopeptidase family protein [Candidatus Aquilonibacter sp.]